MLELTRTTLINLIFNTNLHMLNQENYTAKTSEKTYIELRSQGKVLQFELNFTTASV